MTEEESREIVRTCIGAIATAMLTIAAIDAFGTLRGLGVWAAIWLLSPYQPRAK